MQTFPIILIATSVILLVLSVVFFLMKKKAETQVIQLDKQRGNYESIIDQANDAMLVIDIVDGRIHQSNPSAAAMLGYTKEKLESCSLFELHPKEMLDKSSRVVADVWEKGGLIYKDIPFLTATGELLPVECSAKVAPFSGRPAIVIYARDIRERLRLEAEVQMQKEIIEQKNKDVTDSINYAKGIQQAILSDKKELTKVFPDSFILFRPKDIVSGDFYWFSIKGNRVLLAAADCTGHGVPGALMSMIGNTFFNEIANEKGVTDPAEILNEVREHVIKILKPQESVNQSKDGMDVALCNIDLATLNMQFAGAFNGAWLIREKNLIEITGDKFPIGVHAGGESKPFTRKEMQLQKGDSLYLFTDGFADQFGGPKGKKFKYKQLADLLISFSERPMEEQKEMLKNTFDEWKGSLEQVDDLLVMGVRV